MRTLAPLLMCLVLAAPVVRGDEGEEALHGATLPQMAMVAGAATRAKFSFTYCS